MTKKRVKDWFSDDKDKINVKKWLKTFNTESATECFTAVQELKRGLNNEQV